jgi:hypothetical protein
MCNTFPNAATTGELEMRWTLLRQARNKAHEGYKYEVWAEGLSREGEI